MAGYGQSLRRSAKQSFRALCRVAARGGPASGVRTLMYHSVDDSASALSVSACNFRSQLAWLQKNGWRGLNTAEFLARQDGVEGSPKEVFISFDDGYESTLTVAAPLLASYGYPATVFVPTDLLGGRPSCFVRDRAVIRANIAYSGASAQELERAMAVCSESQLLSWEQLETLGEFGIDVGSHGAAHHFMTRLSERELQVELTRSRQALEDRLDIQVRTIAYPYGDWSPRVAAAARDAGFAAGFLANRRGPRRDDSMAIVRLGINDSVAIADIEHFLSAGGEYEEEILRQFRRRGAP
jgi:peptidoglycan/xylan/chitin deacetylase (PgdA/CDA1 family)